MKVVVITSTFNYCRKNNLIADNMERKSMLKLGKIWKKLNGGGLAQFWKVKRGKSELQQFGACLYRVP